MRWYRHGGDAPPPARPARRPIGYKRVRSDGYVTVKTGPGRAEYQLEHRLVAEKMLGRSLSSTEHVHHINGVRDDNRPENLLVLGSADHQRLHDWRQRYQQHQLEIACERCGVVIRVKPSKASTRRFCSNACRLAALHETNRKT